MSRITLKVNGELREANVEARTQLAAVLRDQLHLTGTHLACEQGVCGACTILVDDKPIRSCIAYAAAYDGARIETVEGFRSDPVMTALRRAFSENHALQCGFCTPGMIITARDIVLRLKLVDERRIRNELSGNLCRCTGYVGIVRAIAEVIGQRAGDSKDIPAAVAPAERPPVRPFTLSEGGLRPGRVQEASSLENVTVTDGWTIVDRRIVLRHPLDEVWAFFSDIARVADCIPGASLRSSSGDSFAGALAIRFGLIKASFQGEGERRLSEGDHSGMIEARGKDASGQSALRGQMIYRLSVAGGATAVHLRVRFQIKGLLAQFNRPDLVEGFVSALLAQFVAACDAALSGKARAAPRTLSAFGLVAAVARQRIGQIFSRRRKD